MSDGGCCVMCRTLVLTFIVFVFVSCSADTRQTQSRTSDALGKALEISSASVDDRPKQVRQGQVNLGAFPRNIAFKFQPTTNFTGSLIRLRHRLEGFENTWHEGESEMYFETTFFDQNGDKVSQTSFPVHGESAGWNGSLTNSQLTHRRETVTVPPRASRLMIVISSAGPPQTEGVYVVANLVVSKTQTNNASATVKLIQSPFDQPTNYNDDDLIQAPPGWVRDGDHASMAKIVRIGSDSAAKAFAILDDDPLSHAVWRNSLEAAAPVNPGDNVVIEWNEMYSMGSGSFRAANYADLAPGNYTFEVEEVNIFGVPTGNEASIRVLVPPPFWRRAWFWSAGAIGVCIIVFAIGRYLTRHKMRREMQYLKSQQALESERVRIAHDIHDDLGARVTQISLLSALSGDNSGFPEKARADFGRISEMCRELVSALYETVWAVNPENDNLDALGTYLCQMVSQLCERTQLSCRNHVSDLPRDVQISSQARHNISMAVKEAVHNAIKHAKASEVVLKIEVKDGILQISIKDDGRGFRLADPVVGHGLANMKRRLADIGGECSIESDGQKGTVVHLQWTIKASIHLETQTHV